MFSYESLSQDAGEVRLVRFTGPSTSSDGDISLTLTHNSLHDKPSYHALSYVWGDPAPTIQVSLNGEPFAISNNLHDVLLQLRQKGVEAWLWVDALCIDQTNSEEKAWQVTQMRDVFGQANVVYICLGPSRDDSDLALEMIQRIGPDALTAGITDLWFDFRPFGQGVAREPETAKHDKPFFFLGRLLKDGDLRSPRLLEAIQALLRRANWYRSWILQEIALARHGLVLCGSKHVSLDAFDAALIAVYFARFGKFARRQPHWYPFGMGIDFITFHLRGLIVRRQHQRGQRVSLLELLLSDFIPAPGRPFYAASDPRDIIFGLLGIAADTDVLKLWPDYDKSVAEAGILHFSKKDTPDLPSWVPDWQRIGLKGVELRPMSSRSIFESSGNRVQPRLAGLGDMSGRLLRRRGCLVDVAAAVLNIGNSSTSTLSLQKALASPRERPYVMMSILDLATPYLKTNASETALWRTLVAGVMNIAAYVKKCGPEYDAIARQTFRQVPVLAPTLTEEQTAYILSNTDHQPRDPKHLIDLQAEVDSFSERIWRMASSTSLGKTLFATAGGSFGLGPENMERGDVVTILFGTQVPIVLRPSGDQFTYLGDAYVHGIMNGEFMEGNPEETDFYIA